MSEQHIAALLVGRTTRLYNALLLSERRVNAAYLIWIHEASVRFVHSPEKCLPLSPLLIFFFLPAWRQSPIQLCCLVGFGSFYNTSTHAKCQQLSLVVNALFLLPLSQQQLYENSTSSWRMGSLSGTTFKFRRVAL